MADSTTNRLRAARAWLLDTGGKLERRFDLDPAILEPLRMQTGQPEARALELAEAAVQLVEAVERATADLAPLSSMMEGVTFDEFLAKLKTLQPKVSYERAREFFEEFIPSVRQMDTLKKLGVQIAGDKDEQTTTPQD